MYVGKAKDLKNRVSSYFTSGELGLKTAQLVRQIYKIQIIQVESEIEALLLEVNFIKKYAPKYNIRLTDGKAYPLIRITKKHMFPAVLTARRMDDKKSLYFGPFPSASTVRMMLRLLRRVFPYVSVLNHPKRFCLYHHLGLCPCPPMFENAQEKTMYAKTIKHIIDFLDGKTEKVIKDLKKERDSLTKNEEFELSAKVQKQIDAIFYITHSTHKPFEYETNPHLKEDLRMQEMQDLQHILGMNGIKIILPTRIECYDNSNFQGTNPTSSMVVLTNGEIDKSEYRKFKIKSVKGPNDFASMQEVLTRRLKHTEWPYPQLLVVDGGKGQVSAAMQAVGNIPLIGLAKREEIIITSDLKEIQLPKHSPALLLIRRIRDEAHRFAITYHRKLRSKQLFF